MYIEYAFNFYKNHIINKEKFNLMKKYNFSINGCIHSSDWELFCALLLNKNKLTHGKSDLEGYEIKSAYKGNSFEYQYHKNKGELKLENDSSTDHIFVVYDTNYTNISVYLVTKNIVKPIIDEWKKDFKTNYESGKQRYRKNISYNFVVSNATILLEIKNEELQ